MNWALQNFDPDQFVSNYWQKKPLLIRQAFTDFKSPISPEELAGLACEPGVHCRLVQEKGDDKPWQLSYGPFDEQTFLDLPDSHYSLLVSECEKWVPELKDLLEQFRFIPNWRIDDLMVSYAPKGGSVGPHLDQYDVFLIQAFGTREWQFSNTSIANPKLLDNCDLAIIEHFQFDESHILQPGDMLYLPPGIPHHGIACGPCLTYSVGFRAPAVSDVLDFFVDEVNQSQLTNFRYTDPNLETRRHASEITANEINQFKQLIAKLVKGSKICWPSIAGKLLSDSLLEENINPGLVDTDAKDLENQVLKFDWQKHPDSRLLYFVDKQQILLFCNGEQYRLSNSDSLLQFSQQLCQQSCYSTKQLQHWFRNDEMKRLLLALIKNQALITLVED